MKRGRRVKEGGTFSFSSPPFLSPKGNSESQGEGGEGRRRRSCNKMETLERLGIDKHDTDLNSLLLLALIRAL